MNDYGKNSAEHGRAFYTKKPYSEDNWRTVFLLIIFVRDTATYPIKRNIGKATTASSTKATTNKIWAWMAQIACKTRRNYIKKMCFCSWCSGCSRHIHFFCPFRCSTLESCPSSHSFDSWISFVCEFYLNVIMFFARYWYIYEYPYIRRRKSNSFNPIIV